MTASPVIGITDELIAELEHESKFGDDMKIYITDSQWRALSAERTELKRDARRYKFLRENPCVDVWVNRHELSHEHLDAAIDSMVNDDE